jgi:tetratricopeptide (TPR) repeat protein
MKTFVFLFSALLFICSACHAESAKLSSNEKVLLANKWLLDSYSITDISVEKLGILLASENFTEIENILSKTEQKFKIDVRYELNLIRAYEAFSRIAEQDATHSSLAHFEKWISQSKSYIPHAAMGFYYAGLAGKARGNKYIGQIPEKNLVIARSFWTKSMSSLNKSISINDKFLPSYDGIIVVGMASGNREAAEKAISSALSNTPEAFYIRVNYIEYLQPKWGGTYEDANKFINAAQKYGEKNPRIWTLRGLVPAMQADQCQLDGKYAMSISKYTEALKYGDKPSWIRGKAFGQYMISDYKGAIESMNRASKYLNPDQKSSLLRVVEVLKAEDHKKGKKGHVSPADTLDENGDFYGPLSWSDFQ